MDPNATLKEIREIIKLHNDSNAPDLSRLVELIEALDEWISNGGFRPEGW